MQPQAIEYTRTAVGLHWLAAFLIVANLALGLYMADLPISPAKLKLYAWHKWVGITVLALSALRLLWRLGHPAPALPISMPAWQQRAARISHLLFYALFFAAPLTGWLFSSASGFPTVYLGVLQLPDLVDRNRELAEALKFAHRSFNYALAALVAVHVAAAVRHQIVDRDGVLARMLPFLRSGIDP